MKKVNKLLTYGLMLGLLTAAYVQFVGVLIELNESAKSETEVFV
jgi:hypothetical protein